MTLHDLVHDFATGMTAVPLALHCALLDAYWRKCPDGWPSGPNDGYFFQHLCDHLLKAGRGDDVFRLLIDSAWLERKATCVGMGFSPRIGMKFGGTACIALPRAAVREFVRSTVRAI